MCLPTGGSHSAVLVLLALLDVALGGLGTRHLWCSTGPVLGHFGAPHSSTLCLPGTRASSNQTLLCFATSCAERCVLGLSSAGFSRRSALLELWCSFAWPLQHSSCPGLKRSATQPSPHSAAPSHGYRHLACSALYRSSPMQLRLLERSFYAILALPALCRFDALRCSASPVLHFSGTLPLRRSAAMALTLSSPIHCLDAPVITTVFVHLYSFVVVAVVAFCYRM